MADRRLPYPLTVPSNFSYLPQDGNIPRTPERLTVKPEHNQAESVPASRFRVRRYTGSRKLSGATFSPPPIMTQNLAEIPIPSIEVATDDSLPAESCPPSAQSFGFLSPIGSQLYPDLPTTPVSQTVSFDGNSWKTAKQREFGESVLRPISACSNFSNSSDESDVSSFASSYGGTTCTSPERGQTDPFITPSKDDKYAKYRDTLMAAARIPDLTSLAPKTKASWSQAMDDHLWTTYQLYLQDPTVTPLKIVPGNAPPLGVCHRVARRARQTWKEPKLRTTAAAAARFSTPQPAEKPALQVDERHAFSDHEGVSSKQSLAGGATWPKGNATRRRLRELAKNRATIPTHYMRLIANRSPSPFASSSRSSHSRQTVQPEQRSGSHHSKRHASSASPNMGTRGVRIALATATSETMQPDGPLARLQRDTPEPTPEPIAEVHVPFNFDKPTIPASPPSMLQAANGPQPSEDHPMADASSPAAIVDAPPRLGSPFVPSRNHTWAAPARRPRTRPAMAPSNLKHAEPSPDSTVRLRQPQELLRPATSTGPRSLRSPIQFTSTFPYNRSLGSKRRAEQSLEDVASPRHNSHRRPALNDVFASSALQEPGRDEVDAPSPIENRRVRLRGFSLNDAIMQSQHERQALHQPPFSALPESDDPFVDSGRQTLPGVHLRSDAPRQLGSPFQATGTVGRPRFRVRHLPHKSLDSYPSGLFGSIGERLGDH